MDDNPASIDSFDDLLERNILLKMSMDITEQRVKKR